MHYVWTEVAQSACLVDQHIGPLVILSDSNHFEKHEFNSNDKSAPKANEHQQKSPPSFEMF